MPNLFDVPFQIPDGSLTESVLSSAFALPVANNASRSSAIYGIPLSSMRKPADMTAVLPSSNTTGDGFLKMVSGTHGTATPKLSTSDFASASGTQGLRFEFILPPNYENGKAIVVRIPAKWDANVPNDGNDLDCRAFLSDGLGGITGTDKCQTAVQNPTATLAEYSFALSTTGLVAGDKLDIVIDIAADDSSAAACELFIGDVEVLVQTQG